MDEREIIQNKNANNKVDISYNTWLEGQDSNPIQRLLPVFVVTTWAAR